MKTALQIHVGRALLAIVISVSLGCATQVNKVMESWMGHNISEVIGNWGPPQQVVDLGPDSRLFVWSSVRSWTTPGTATTTTTAYGDLGYGNAYSTTTYNPPQT